MWRCTAASQLGARELLCQPPELLNNVSGIKQELLDNRKSLTEQRWMGQSSPDSSVQSRLISSVQFSSLVTFIFFQSVVIFFPMLCSVILFWLVCVRVSGGGLIVAVNFLFFLCGTVQLHVLIKV